MPLQQTSGNVTADAYGGGVAVVPKYIEDYFSTFLYSGNDTSQSIANGIDLSTKGGMVWAKARTAATNNIIWDTARGVQSRLTTNSTAAAVAGSTEFLSSFNTTGFTVTSTGSGADPVNDARYQYTSWSWAKAPKFFDVVTFTSTSSTNQRISHSLGSVPGMIIVKGTNNPTAWMVWHRSLSTTTSSYMELQSTAAQQSQTNVWGTSGPTSTDFGIDGSWFGSGGQWVAYIYAHNAGGFGLTGTDNVISCGSFTTDATTGNATINLGYEPQWIITKMADGLSDWTVYDNMRGMSLTNSYELFPNSSSSEVNYGSPDIIPSATGFSISYVSGSGQYGKNKNIIYIAIRRGPMKVPTDATKVFQPIIDTGDTVETSTATFPLDMQFNTFYDQSNATFNSHINDRLRGIGFAPTFTATPHLTTASTAAETTTSTYLAFKGNGMDVTKDNGWGSWKALFYNFRRAPSTFDEVCYTGDGTSNRAIPHNLSVMPELIISKKRSAAGEWYVWSKYYSYALGTAPSVYCVGQLDSNMALNGGYSETQRFSPTPTASNTYTGSITSLNNSGDTYVSYLWATNAGVTKVGTYTGNGSSKTINCGFTGGARFVMIKATSTTGNWLVADSARGIVSGNDPALYLNSTSAEVTGFDWIDADNSGFIVNETSTIAANTNGVQYLFLAYA